MLRKFLFIFLIIVFTPGIRPESDEIYSFDFIDTLIKNQKYDLAEIKLDEILKESPDNPDALMYKGVILYYRESVSLKTNHQWKVIEDIYEPEYKENDFENSTISPETAKKISRYFLQSLKTNPNQINVQLGLCFAYAKAGLSDELISRLPYLKQISINNDNMQQNMTDYALIIAKNHSQVDGIRVLNEITKLYPDDSNILSEIGLLYFHNGEIHKSMSIFQQLEGNSDISKEAAEKLLLVYSITGDYSKIVHLTENMKKVIDNDLLYKALEERLENNHAWYETIREYLKKTNDSENDVELFADLLKKSEKNRTFEKFIESTQYNVPAPMIAMNHAWGVNQYPKRFETLFNYADFLTYHKHYQKALNLYKAILERNILMNDLQKEDFYFHYAWALHQTGQTLKAQQYWRRLIESENFYKKSAASYFIGKYFFERKDYDLARKYFSYVKDKPDKSKYADFCLTMYKEISR